MFRVHQVFQGEYDPKADSVSNETLAPTLYGPRLMLAHRFKELLALANQAGKGFASKHPLDSLKHESRLVIGSSLQNRYWQNCFVLMLVDLMFVRQ